MPTVSNVFFVPDLGDETAEQKLRIGLQELGLVPKASNLGGFPDLELVNFLYLSLGVLAKDVVAGMATDVVKASLTKAASWVRGNKRQEPSTVDYAAEVHMYHSETGDYLGCARVIFPPEGPPRIISDPGPSL
ncbi:hypothetical protein [Arthrobacter zhaoxinii]|uniref:hypothetical protein n=1 Tax=Arthrobacter zhaoxinii TaxID=2964616 RepID=UPI0021068CF2|nr:hypothetical protein [Arthrobacter zhaoxinii]MCQ2002219.1 hypothetical protein [Arthrobacter zhaoxinii]